MFDSTCDKASEKGNLIQTRAAPLPLRWGAKSWRLIVPFDPRSVPRFGASFNSSYALNPHRGLNPLFYNDFVFSLIFRMRPGPTKPVVP